LFHALNWLDEAFKNTGRGPVPVILLANKEDLRSEVPRAVKKSQGMQLASKINNKIAGRGFTCSFIETSAKTGLDVDRAFKKLGEEILVYVDKLMMKEMETAKPRGTTI